MRRLILHIGRQKSGTSALQFFLRQNKELLLQKDIIYPEAGRDGKIAHHYFAFLLKDEKYGELKKVVNNIVDESRSFKNTIISSEAFQNAIDIYSMNNLIKHYDQTTVICYLRESLSYLLSAYKQKVQAQNYSGSIVSFLNSAKLDYKRLVNRWRQLDDGIILRLYERSVLKNENIIDDFFQSVGLDLSEEFSDLRSSRNTSIGSNLVLYKIVRNRLNLSERTDYKILEQIARENESERSELFLPLDIQNKFRQKDKNNHYLKSLFGSFREKDFSKNQPWIANDQLRLNFEKYNSYFDVPIPLELGTKIASEFIAQQ